MTDTDHTQEYRITDSSSYVRIRYSVRIAGGPVLKGATEPEIMEFVTGYRQVVPGLEEQLIGHGAGERLSFTVEPEKAFGPRYDELVAEKGRSEFHFPPGFQPVPGMELPLVTAHPDAPDTIIIRKVGEDTIVVDANHPLAGKSLEYNLEIVEAREATEKDVCAEWEQQKSNGDESCCGGGHRIVLGAEDETVH